MKVFLFYICLGLLVSMQISVLHAKPNEFALKLAQLAADPENDERFNEISKDSFDEVSIDASEVILPQRYPKKWQKTFGPLNARLDVDVDLEVMTQTQTPLDVTTETTTANQKDVSTTQADADHSADSVHSTDSTDSTDSAEAAMIDIEKEVGRVGTMMSTMWRLMSDFMQMRHFVLHPSFI